MSDESSPPLLRLKPRVRLESDASTTQQAVVLEPGPTPAVAPSAAVENSSNQPRLRLKPKLTSEETPAESPAVSPVDAQAAPPAPAEAPAKPVISLRPAQPAAVATPTPASDAPPAPPRASMPPPPPPAATPPAAEGAPKLKFNLQRPAPASNPPPAPEPTATTDTKPRPPPFPVVAPAAPDANPLPPTATRLPPPPQNAVPHLRAPQRMLDGATSAKPAPAEQQPVPKKAAKQYLTMAAMIVFIIGGLIAFRVYRQNARAKAVPPTPAATNTTAAKAAPAAQPIKSATVANSPTPAPAATASTPAQPATPKLAGDPNPTPSETLNTLAHAPARAIAKAQATIDAAQRREQDRVDAFGGTGTNALPPPPASKPVATKPTPPVTSTSQVAPGVSATTTVSAGASGTASAELRSWVASARLSGVFSGANPRALINGRMVQPGQVVDETLKITFDKIEADGKTLVFRDASGATVSRRF